MEKAYLLGVEASTGLAAGFWQLAAGRQVGRWRLVEEIDRYSRSPATVWTIAGRRIERGVRLSY